MLSKIFWIESFPDFRLGTMARPRGGDWLEDEIKGWKNAGVGVVASALTDEEIFELDLANVSELCATCGIEFHRYFDSFQRVKKIACRTLPDGNWESIADRGLANAS